jgi:hypothetical protein
MTKTQTPSRYRALEDLQDAIRAEVRAELIAELREWWEASRGDYVPGGDAEGAISDAIITLEG